MPVSRRRFLASTAGALGTASLLSACGGEPPVDSTTCAGYAGLSEADLARRAALDYVDESPKMGLRCTNCKVYIQPADYNADLKATGSPCGGCQLFPGPVAPGGWCSGWVSG